MHTNLPGLGEPKRGKVREVYDLGDQLLIVATDRISAYDVIMANGVPEKGVILTQLSAHWFYELKHLAPHHLLSVDDATICEAAELDEDNRPLLAGRSMLAKKAKPLPVECVARGYITGSLYRQYQKEGGQILGLDLPRDLQDGDRLPEPLFTPATKAEEGHDENISFKQMADLVGQKTAEYLRDVTLKIYNRAAQSADDNGLILADTKFEFGETEDGIVWIDEALTPDSSRYWEKRDWKPGQIPANFDKQYVRNYLDRLDWNKQPPGPQLPQEVLEGTRKRYREAYRRLTGRSL